MRTLRIVAATTLLALSLSASLSAQASPISMGVVYTLNDHPDGGARPPTYGLRLDGLTTGDDSDIFTFEFSHELASMTMVWNADNSLSISGLVFGGLNNGPAYAEGRNAPGVWRVSFTYDSLVLCGTGLCANNGRGSISSGESNYLLVAESGNHPFAFQLNQDHRGFTGTSGWGWVNHCVYGTPASECTQHLYSSDWLFTVDTTSVPEPSTLLLFGAALFGAGVFGRKRQPVTVQAS